MLEGVSSENIVRKENFYDQSLQNHCLMQLFLQTCKSSSPLLSAMILDVGHDTKKTKTTTNSFGVFFQTCLSGPKFKICFLKFVWIAL